MWDALIVHYFSYNDSFLSAKCLLTVNERDNIFKKLYSVGCWEELMKKNAPLFTLKVKMRQTTMNEF